MFLEFTSTKFAKFGEVEREVREAPQPLDRVRDELGPICVERGRVSAWVQGSHGDGVGMGAGTALP